MVELTVNAEGGRQVLKKNLLVTTTSGDEEPEEDTEEVEEEPIIDGYIRWLNLTLRSGAEGVPEGDSIRRSGGDGGLSINWGVADSAEGVVITVRNNDTVIMTSPSLEGSRWISWRQLRQGSLVVEVSIVSDETLTKTMSWTLTN